MLSEKNILPKNLKIKFFLVFSFAVDLRNFLNLFTESIHVYFIALFVGDIANKYLKLKFEKKIEGVNEKKRKFPVNKQSFYILNF